MGVQQQSDLANFEQHRKIKGTFPKYCGFKREGLGPPKSPMSLTAPGNKGVVADFTDATPVRQSRFRLCPPLIHADMIIYYRCKYGNLL